MYLCAKTIIKTKKLILPLLLAAFVPALFFVSGCREDGTSDNFFGTKPDGGGGNAPVPDWKLVGDIDFMMRPGRSPILYFNYLVPHIAYIDDGYFSKVSVGRFDGFLWRKIDERGSGFSSAEYHAFVIYKNTLYSAYTESDRENRISVTGYINGAWQYIGAPGFTHKKANYLDFKISDPSNDKFYVAYCNGDNFDRPYAFMRYGADWAQLGAASISSAGAKEIKLEVLDDTPYAAYIEKTAVDRISVLKYNKTAGIWEHIGGQAFSPPYAAYLNFRAIEGKLHIAYSDGMANGRARVAAYDGASWKTIDGAGVSDGPASFCALADYNGALYLAYCDHTKEKRITVMKYEGGKWSAVGRRDFSSTGAVDISLAVNQGVPYIAYRDREASDKIMVWKYE